MPVTPMPQLALDLAAALPLNPLRKALANLEYRRLIDKRTLESEACGRGKPGAAKLREALARPMPLLAKTKSPSEDDLLFVLEARGVRLPDEANVYVEGKEADAVWHDAMLIVEIDGEGNHGEWDQIIRDNRGDAIWRAAGYQVLRYTADELRDEPDRIAAEIARELISRTRRSAANESAGL
jgi:very-short-patch-repair endonuclease